MNGEFDRLSELIMIDIVKNGIPDTQKQCCALAARIGILTKGAPATDFERIDVALDLARGLFGSAFKRADDNQKITWITMCEEALRAAEFDEDLYV